MKKHGFLYELKKNKVLFLMAMPSVLLTFFLAYLPMSGLVLAFKNYRYDRGIFGSDWNGFDNFAYLFQSGTGWLITKNTILYNLLNLFVSQLLAVIVAIVISEMMGAHLQAHRAVGHLPAVLYFLGYRRHVRAQPLQLRDGRHEQPDPLLRRRADQPVHLGDGVGLGHHHLCVQLLEMGRLQLDHLHSGYHEPRRGMLRGGRHRRRQRVPEDLVHHIPVDQAHDRHDAAPLQVGRILRGDFEMFYQIIGSNGQLYNATDVIDTYVFRALLTNPNMGMTAAASFYQSALCFIIIMVVNNIVKRIEADYALF